MKPGFIQIPRTLTRSGALAEIGGSACLVLIVLMDHADSDGYCFPSIARIHQMTGLSKSSVVRSLERLESLGLLLVERSKGRHNAYTVTPNRPKKQASCTSKLVSNLDHKLVSNLDLSGVKFRPEPVSNLDRSGVKFRPEPVSNLDPKYNQEEEPTKKNQEEGSSEPCSEHCSEPSSEPPSSEFEFPVRGSKKTWRLPEGKRSEYLATYGDALDVDLELRKARQWLRDNPSRKKTASGMPAFLTRWMTRALERPPPNVSGSALIGDDWFRG